MQQGAARQNISGELADKVRNMIVDGAIEAGARVNEVHLARELGVSRTPLREAIAQLVREKTLISVPRIGSFVKPLTLDEFEAIYPIRALLDPEALRVAGLPSKAQIDKLRRLNERIGAARTPDDIIARDEEWHLMLVERCPNPALIELIEDFMRRTRRYELALMREQRSLQVATGEHADILDALELGDLPGACAALRANMESGFEPIVRWLCARGGTQSA
jgi:DNA-binding GntR family transcriptional regulator